MRNTDTTDRMSLTKPMACLVVAWAVVIVSLGAEIKFGGDWLARSGSLMVLLSVIANYTLLRVRDAYHSQKLKQHEAGDSTVDFSEIHPSGGHRYLETISQFSIVVGTVIWGYGDLLLPLHTSVAS